MPEHPRVPGVQCSIVGHPGAARDEFYLAEYPGDDPNSGSDPPTSIRWVECRSGLYFAIEVSFDDDFADRAHSSHRQRGRAGRRQRRQPSRDEPEFDAIKLVAYIDGQRVVSRNLPRSTLQNGHTANYPRGTVRGRTGRFQFAPLAVDDSRNDEDADYLQRQFYDLASIRVELFRLRCVGHRSSRSELLNGRDTGIPEEAYKGKMLSHRTLLRSSDTNASHAPKPLNPKYGDIDRPDDPMVTYVFHYRSHKILRFFAIKPPNLSEMARRQERRHENLDRIGEFEPPAKRECSAGAADEDNDNNLLITHANVQNTNGDGTATNTGNGDMSENPQPRDAASTQASRNAVMEAISNLPKKEDSERAAEFADFLHTASGDIVLLGQRPTRQQNQKNAKRDLDALYQQQIADVGQEEADHMLAVRLQDGSDDEQQDDDGDIVLVAHRSIGNETSNATKNSNGEIASNASRLFVSPGSSPSCLLSRDMFSPDLGNGSSNGSGRGDRGPASLGTSQRNRSDRHTGQQSPRKRDPPGNGRRRRPNNHTGTSGRFTTPENGIGQAGPSSSTSAKRRRLESQADLEVFNREFADEMQSQKSSDNQNGAPGAIEASADAEEQQQVTNADTAAIADGAMDVDEGQRANSDRHAASWVDVTDSNDDGGT